MFLLLLFFQTTCFLNNFQNLLDFFYEKLIVELCGIVKDTVFKTKK